MSKKFYIESIMFFVFIQRFSPENSSKNHFFAFFIVYFFWFYLYYVKLIFFNSIHILHISKQVPIKKKKGLTLIL
jgi:hypothetical protein